MSLQSKKYLLIFSVFVNTLILCFYFTSTTAHAELNLESVYPTLGMMGQDLDVTLTGTGFDQDTRVSMYLDSCNRIMLVGSVDTPGSAEDIVVSGSYAYVADWGSGLQVIDISSGTSPFIIGSVDTPGYARGVFISGSYAYVADGGSGLQVIDISSGTSPYITGFVDTPGYARGVFVSGNYAYVADGECGLQVIDISSGSSPYILGSLDTPGEAWSVFVKGNYVYVADGTNGLQIIDISEPSSPHLYGFLNMPGWAHGVFVSGSYAYLAHTNYGLEVIDISDPSSPHIIGTAVTPDDAWSVFVKGNYAYVANRGGGLQIIDISNPLSPQIIGSVATLDFAWDVVVSSDYAYVGDGDKGLQVIDISNPLSPQIIGAADTQGEAWSVFVKGNYAYVADGTNGLQVIDVSDPFSPQITGSVDTADDFTEVVVSGNYAYVAVFNRLLQVIDISSGTTPFIIGSVDKMETAYGIAVSGDYAYVASGFSGLYVIDISSGTTPFIIGSVDTPHYARGVFVSGNYAYVADGGSGLQVYDISSGTTPQFKGAVDTPDYSVKVVVSGNYAYVADAHSGLQVIDITNPSNPQIIGSVDTPGNACGVVVSGNYAYVADRSNGLQVIDISNPSNPMIIGSVDTPGSANGVAVSGSYAYALEPYSGLVIVPLPLEISPVTVNSGTNISVTLPSPLLAGHYTLRVFNETENSELFSAVSFTDDPSTLASKAIIVAGGGPNASGGSIWEETKVSANKAYDALILQGYQHDSIYYISEEAANDYVDINNPETFLSELSDAIEEWAADASQLLIYFVDHGQEDKFVLNADGDTTQILTVQELDGWLDNLQETMTGPVNFIYDACQSGSFISKMRPPAGRERIIITSSSYEPAYFLENGEGSFSYQFWDKTIFNRGNVGEAFSYAENAMRSYQSARIEANWDLEGETNEKEDMSPADNMTIQRGGYAYIGVHPFINTVCDRQIISEGTSATICVSGVIDSESVHAMIIPPNVNPETSDIPITDLDTIELKDPDGDHVYEGIYNKFSTEGTYAIVIKAKSTHELYSYISKAMTTHNIYSPSMHTSVTQTSGTQSINPDSYEEDDTFSKANVIVLNNPAPQSHNFHDVGDEDWVKFYGISGETYKIKTSNLSVVCDTVIEVFESSGTTSVAGPKNNADAGYDEFLEWTCTQDRVYYVKISSANSNFGETVSYELKVYQPVGPGLTGWIEGQVTDSVSTDAIGDFVITTSENRSAINMGSGYYMVANHPAGYDFTITARAGGYCTYKNEEFDVLDGVINPLNINMVPLKKGDINGDGLLSQADLDLALQVLAGKSPAGIRADYVSSSVDVNGDDRIGMEELIYIREKMSGIR